MNVAPKGATALAKRRKRSRTAAQSGWLGKIVASADRLAFAWPVRQNLYRHLSAQVSNGVPLETALDTFRSRLQRRGKVSSDKIVADVARRMRDGSTFAKAMSTWVPPDEHGVIESGELSGNLSEGLELIIEGKRRLQSVRRAIKGALMAPTVYLVMIYGVMWTIGQMTPDFEKTLPREKAEGLVRALYTAGEVTNSWWMVLPATTLIALIIAVILSLPKWTGRYRIKAEGVFPYSFYRDLNGYTWLMSFAALYSSGLEDVEILKRQKEHANPWLRERLQSIWWRMDSGRSLGEALLDKGRNGMPAFDFPNPDIIDDIVSTSGFSDFPKRIIVIAKQWANDLEHDTLAKAKAFGVIAELVMFSMMGFLVLAINALSTQIGSVPAM